MGFIVKPVMADNMILISNRGRGAQTQLDLFKIINGRHRKVGQTKYLIILLECFVQGLVQGVKGVSTPSPFFHRYHI